jgi:hypothetical protein
MVRLGLTHQGPLRHLLQDDLKTSIVFFRHHANVIFTSHELRRFRFGGSGNTHHQREEGKEVMRGFTQCGLRNR